MTYNQGRQQVLDLPVVVRVMDNGCCGDNCSYLGIEDRPDNRHKYCKLGGYHTILVYDNELGGHLRCDICTINERQSK